MTARVCPLSTRSHAHCTALFDAADDARPLPPDLGRDDAESLMTTVDVDGEASGDEDEVVNVADEPLLLLLLP